MPACANKVAFLQAIKDRGGTKRVFFLLGVPKLAAVVLSGLEVLLISH